MNTKEPADRHEPGKHSYRKLALMVVLMFIVMFALMYAMVDRVDNVFVNLNQIYMAGLMTAAMVVIELLVMAGMYPDRRANAAILVVSVVALAAFWFAIREQAVIGDRQFLRSMVPHHAGAILMCEEVPLQDSRIKALCAQILASQREEIRQMQDLLTDDPAAGRE